MVITAKGNEVTRDAGGVARTSGAKPESVRVGCACTRCGGSGVYHTYGACFRCGGNGEDPTGVREWAFPAAYRDADIEVFFDRKRARAASARARAAAKRVAAGEAQLAANVEAFPVLAEILADDAILYSSEFVSDVVGKARRFDLSERQGAALVSAVERFRARAVEDLDRPVSVFQGVVGERLRGVEVTVAFERGFPSQFGTSYLVVMVDGVGNVFKTFGSGAFCGSAVVGDAAVVTGTVKAHEVYGGVEQTVLARVAV